MGSGSKRVLALAAASAVTVLLGVMTPAATALGAASPVAERNLTEVPMAVTLHDPKTTTIEYGQYWRFEFSSDYLWNYDTRQAGGVFTVLDGAPDSYQAATYVAFSPLTGGWGGSVGASESSSLPAGNYPFRVTVDYRVLDTHYVGHSVDGRLVVTPAKVTAEVRALPDESNPSNILITARLTGRFVEEFVPSYYYSEGPTSAAPSPAGSWNLSVADAEGTTVKEWAVPRTLGDDLFTASVYWTEAEPGEDYTVSGEFVASGGSEKNFAATAALPFRFTSSSDQRVYEESTAPPATTTDLPPEPDFSVPVWWVILIGIALVALLAFAVVFAVRLRSTPSAADQRGIAS